VADFNPMPPARFSIRKPEGAAKPRHVVINRGKAQDFFAAATVGKVSSDLILARPDGGPWGKNHQQAATRRGV